MISGDSRAVPGPTHAAMRWAQHRTVTSEQIPPLAALHARKSAEEVRISVAVPAMNEGPGAARVCRAISEELMTEVPLVDELVVLSSLSEERPLTEVRAAGASVVDIHEVMPELPLQPGRGDALWRSLSAMSGDVVVWVDPDLNNFGAHVVARLVAPILTDPTVRFVKGYHEPTAEIDVEIDGVTYVAGGERVTGLLVRPLINILFPELGGFFEPLATEYAGRMDLFTRIPFLSGSSVDVATLIDSFSAIGLDGMAQVELGPRAGRVDVLEELVPKAYAIARTILTRAQERKRIKLAPNAAVHPLLMPKGTALDLAHVQEIERPPIDVVAAYLEALRVVEATPGDGLSRLPVNGRRPGARVLDGKSWPLQSL